MRGARRKVREVRAQVGGDTRELRKARGAFFTPEPISRFIAHWAIRSGTDRVLEPSAGDAEFMIAAASRLRSLSNDGPFPVVEGIEIHEASAVIGRDRVLSAGAFPAIRVKDFFDTSADPVYDAVIGNPPYIRYQGFTGSARVKAREAARAAGVALSGLASSWAAFTVHAASFLRDGGRLGLVLPAELLSVNYAAPVGGSSWTPLRTSAWCCSTSRCSPRQRPPSCCSWPAGTGAAPQAMCRSAGSGTPRFWTQWVRPPPCGPRRIRMRSGRAAWWAPKPLRLSLTCRRGGCSPIFKRGARPAWAR